MSDTSPRTQETDEPTVTLFTDLELDPKIVRATDALGFKDATPIQSEAIPRLMGGADIIGGARTGSGKTAAFGLPLVHMMREGGRKTRGLVLAPTRELAKQVATALDTFAKFLPLQILTIYGGVGYREQLRGLKSGATIVVGTPGRVLDHIKRGTLDLSELEMLVLDEADEMLQMGFIEDIEHVFSVTPSSRQVALFSATMPDDIRRIAQTYLNDPVSVQVESEGLTASHIDQRWVKVSPYEKTDALCKILMTEKLDATLIFARTRAGTAKLAGDLNARGFAADAIHGDLGQASRETVIERLTNRQINIVVATDVAARGIDIDHISHVVNYDMPDNTETYVHRIGRTARAGREGCAITLVTGRDKYKLGRLKRELKQSMTKMPIPGDAEVAAYQRGLLVKELEQMLDHKNIQHAEKWLIDLIGPLNAAPAPTETAQDDPAPVDADAIVEGEGEEAVTEEVTTEEATVEEPTWDATRVATAALMLLAKERNLDLNPSKPKRTERHRNDRRDRDDFGDSGKKQRRDNRERGERGEAPSFDHRNQVELFFPAGRRDGLRPADFVGALCNEAGLSSNLIGRITLGGNKTFVGVPLEVAESLLMFNPSLSIRNNEYPIELSNRPPGSREEDERRSNNTRGSYKGKKQRGNYGPKKPHAANKKQRYNRKNKPARGKKR